jgi:hypothetical protein
MVFWSQIRCLSSFFPSGCLPFGFTSLSGGDKFGVSLRLDHFGAALEFVDGRDIADAAEADKFLKVFKVFRDTLGAVVGDNPRLGVREQLPSPLQDDFDIRFGHCLADLPMHDITTETVQYAAQIIKGAADIEVGNVNMPMFMGPIH